MQNLSAYVKPGVEFVDVVLLWPYQSPVPARLIPESCSRQRTTSSFAGRYLHCGRTSGKGASKDFDELAKGGVVGQLRCPSVKKEECENSQGPWLLMQGTIPLKIISYESFLSGMFLIAPIKIIIKSSRLTTA